MIISTINSDINSNTANIKTQHQQMMATITDCENFNAWLK